MADSELLVTISGAALSLLFYENARSIGDQMGFFVGEVLAFVTKNVTDSERHVESVKIHVDIHSIIPCSPAINICGPRGTVDYERLKAMLRETGRHVVGWFRYRKNATLTPTLKDKILHKQFMSIFKNERCNDNYFVACMLNSSTTIGGGTHKFKHVFLHYKNGLYRPIPLKINNLSHDATRLDDSDYKPTPIKYSNYPDAFEKLIESLNLNVNRMSGLELVQRIQKASEDHLTKLVPRVVESDREVAALEKKLLEVKERRIRDLITERSRLSNDCIMEEQVRTRKDPEDDQQNDRVTRKSSPSGSSRSSDDNALEAEPSNSIKITNRHSISSSVNLTSNEMPKNPYVRLLCNDAEIKKNLEKGRDGSDANC